MTKAEQKILERRKTLELRRKFAKARKKQKTFGNPFAKRNTVFEWEKERRAL